MEKPNIKNDEALVACKELKFANNVTLKLARGIHKLICHYDGHFSSCIGFLKERN